MDPIILERAVFQWIGVITDLGEIATGEFIGIHQQITAGSQCFDIGLQRRRVHRDEHVGSIARGHDVVIGEMQLEG